MAELNEREMKILNRGYDYGSHHGQNDHDGSAKDYGWDDGVLRKIADTLGLVRTTLRRILSRRHAGGEGKRTESVVESLCRHGLARSMSEAKRNVLQGAVKHNGEKILDCAGVVTDGDTLQVGKYRGPVIVGSGEGKERGDG